MISIAIDGPSGAGKSSLARAAAQKLGYLYIDTGALYRTIALAVLRSQKDTTSPEQVLSVLPSIQVELAHKEGEQRVYLNGEDVSEAIRENPVSLAASDVSSMEEVRAFLLDLQRDLAAKNNVIMDGRDIGTVILPHAQVKIFLTATPQDRTHRRYRELMSKGMPVNYDDLLREMIQRDEQDTQREISPLKQAEDAILMDTSGMTLEQSLEKLLVLIEEKLS